MDKRDLIKEKIKNFSAEDKKKIKNMAEKGINCFPKFASDLEISQQSLNNYLKLLL